MSGPAEISVAAGILVDSGLKATGILAGGWLLTGVLGRASAAQRHAVWVAALGALPVLPLLAASRGPDVALELPWIVGVWALGTLATLVPLGLGLRTLHSLRKSTWIDPEDPRVSYSDRLDVPVTWGLLHPIIVLPACAVKWPKASREAAIAHERAHVARRDWAIHVVSWVICALFWFHPLSWAARRALIREAEHAADDAVLRSGIRPSDYASLLVELARKRPPSVALGVGPSMLAKRIDAILNPRRRTARRWPVGLAALALAAVATPTLAAWPLWSPPPEPSLTCLPQGPTR